jgi:hypothetical protein
VSLLSIPSGSDSSLEDMELCYERIQKDGIEQFYNNHPVECPTDRAGGSVSQPKEGSHEVVGVVDRHPIYTWAFGCREGILEILEFDRGVSFCGVVFRHIALPPGTTYT